MQATVKENGLSYSDRQELAKSHIGLPDVVFKKHFIKWERNRDDLISDGMQALWVCCVKWNPEKKKKFMSYAYKAIRRRMEDRLTRLVNSSNRCSFHDVDSDFFRVAVSGCVSEAEGDSEEFDITGFIDRKLGLVGVKRSILLRLMNGESFRDIYKDCGYSNPKSCFTTFREHIKRKIKKNPDLLTEIREACIAS